MGDRFRLEYAVWSRVPTIRCVRQEHRQAERRTKRGICAAVMCALLLTVQGARTPAAAGPAHYESYCKDSPALAQSKDYFEYDPDKAYAFGLRIQQFVRDRDLSGLFSLVDGELRRGPRRSYVEGKSFEDVFPQDWRTAILSAGPECSPVGWRGFMLASGRIWYRHMGDDRYTIISVSDWKPGQFPPVPMLWRVGARVLSAGCFVYQWLSGDNFEAFEDAYNIRGTSADFSRRPGAWLGNPIDVERGAWPGDERVELWRAVRRCSRPPSHITGFKEDGTVL